MVRLTSLRPKLIDQLVPLMVFLSLVSTVESANRIRRQGFVFETGSSSSDACFTKDGQEGVCIEVVKCDEATRILSSNPTPAQRRLLTERTCRFEGGTPFFCCITGRTDGQPEVTPPPVRPPPTSAPPPPPPVTPPPVTPGPPTPQGKAMTLADIDKVCGMSNGTGIRVVGGQPALPNGWPWMAAIFIADPRGVIATNEVSCGGVLISEWYILTAAHCAINRDTRQTRSTSEFKVRLGDLDINSNDDGVNPVDFDVTEVAPHAQYSQDTHTNDIAVLRLNRATAFTVGILPICLPTPESIRTMDLVDRTPTIAGWGTVEFRGQSSSILRQVILTVVSNTQCQQAFRRFGMTIKSTHLCAGFERGGKDACQGDSGGPLMLPFSNKWYTIGVVSVGFECARADTPGIYSRTTEYLDWIKTNAKLQ